MDSNPYATEEQYAFAIERGRRLYHQQKRKIWSNAGAAVDFQARYNVQTGQVDSSTTRAYDPVLRAENVNAGNFSFTDVTSRRGPWNATCITRVQAKSGCLVIFLMNKEYDLNLDENKLRPSELIWQSYA